MSHMSEISADLDWQREEHENPCPEDDIPDLTPDELRAQIEEGRADYEYERRGDL